MAKTDNSYRSILKATSLFGGVQVVQILINLIRGKFVAMFLGPEGMGISSMFTSASNTIQRFASLGLNLAIVKEVATDGENNNTLAVASRLIRLTALAGALICALFALPLSRLTFGSDSFAWQFVILAAGVFLAVESTGKLSILQGLHKVKDISRGTIIGSLTGLFVGVPLYYFFGNKGIVPAIVLLSLSLYISYSLPLRKLTASNTKFCWKDHYPLIKRLIILGIVLMANDLLSTLTTYLINIFIRSNGSESAVGLYQAAYSITNQYSGVIFATLAMDYFPRLSEAASDTGKMNQLVNRQTEIVALLMAPAATLLILSSPLAIRILLTPDFFPILDLMRWMGLGILIRALSLPMGYISFAKGNKKLFFWMEGIGCNLLTLLLSCIFFHFFGLIGLGYALVADNSICLITYYCVNRSIYDYRFSATSLRLLSVSLSIGIIGFIASQFSSEPVSYTLMAAIFILSLIIAYKSLRQKTHNQEA